MLQFFILFYLITLQLAVAYEENFSEQRLLRVSKIKQSLSLWVTHKAKFMEKISILATFLGAFTEKEDV